MIEFLKHLEVLCRHPCMFVARGSYAEVAAYVSGYDAATHGGALVGFDEWLMVGLDGFERTGWPYLVLYSEFPDRDGGWDKLTEAEEQEANQALFRLFKEFESVRSKKGLGSIFLAHEAWLKKRNQ